MRTQSKVQVKVLNKFKPLVTKPKRTKIIVGGRGSTKSTFVADYILACMAHGQLWCCAREYQNSIDESVHRLLIDESERLDVDNQFNEKNNQLFHVGGGRNFYKGLARNILSLKGILSGVDGIWIEEGEGVGEDSLRVLTGSVRLTAKDYDIAEREGLDLSEIKQPEIWITMNRGSREDPIAKHYLARAEPDLARCGYYEDKALMVVEANYTDMPKKWFVASGLETERKDDEQNLSKKKYDHKWHGKYLEAIDNGLIEEDWFDACIDAHLKLGFEPTGLEVVSFDPSDMGEDPAGLLHRHGSVYIYGEELRDGDVNEKTDYALDYAIDKHVDHFVWDEDGLGAPLRKNVAEKIGNKKISFQGFRGSEGVEDPDKVFIDTRKVDNGDKPRTNKDVFYNRRSQQYSSLADKMYRTWQAVVKKKYHNPDDLISFSSEMKIINKLRTELCNLPLKPNGNSKIQIYSKQDMRDKFKLPSPNLGDSAMMGLESGQKAKSKSTRTYKKWGR